MDKRNKRRFLTYFKAGSAAFLSVGSVLALGYFSSFLGAFLNSGKSKRTSNDTSTSLTPRDDPHLHTLQALAHAATASIPPVNPPSLIPFQQAESDAFVDAEEASDAEIQEAENLRRAAHRKPLSLSDNTLGTSSITNQTAYVGVPLKLRFDLVKGLNAGNTTEVEITVDGKPLPSWVQVRLAPNVIAGAPSPQGPSGSAAQGVAWRGSSVVVADYAGFWEFNPNTNTTFYLPLMGNARGNALAISESGEYGYFAAQAGGFQIVRFTPSHSVIGVLPLAGENTRRVAVLSPGVIAVVTATRTLLVDVTSPEHPEIIASHPAPSGFSNSGVATAGGSQVFVATNLGTQFFHVSPTDNTLIQTGFVPSGAGGFAHEVTATLLPDGNALLGVADRGAGTQILLANAETGNSTLLTTIENAPGGLSEAATMSGPRLLVADRTNVQVINFQEPSSPIPIDNIPSDTTVWSVAATNQNGTRNLVAIAADRGGILVVDLDSKLLVNATNIAVGGHQVSFRAPGNQTLTFHLRVEPSLSATGLDKTLYKTPGEAVPLGPISITSLIPNATLFARLVLDPTAGGLNHHLYNATSGVLTLSGGSENITAALSALTYTPEGHQPSSVNATVSDGGTNPELFGVMKVYSAITLNGTVPRATTYLLNRNSFSLPKGLFNPAPTDPNPLEIFASAVDAKHGALNLIGPPLQYFPGNQSFLCDFRDPATTGPVFVKLRALGTHGSASTNFTLSVNTVPLSLAPLGQANAPAEISKLALASPTEILALTPQGLVVQTIHAGSGYSVTTERIVAFTSTPTALATNDDYIFVGTAQGKLITLSKGDYTEVSSLNLGAGIKAIEVQDSTVYVALGTAGFAIVQDPLNPHIVAQQTLSDSVTHLAVCSPMVYVGTQFSGIETFEIAPDFSLISHGGTDSTTDINDMAFVRGDQLYVLSRRDGLLRFVALPGSGLTLIAWHRAYAATSFLAFPHNIFLVGTPGITVLDTRSAAKISSTLTSIQASAAAQIGTLVVAITPNGYEFLEITGKQNHPPVVLSPDLDRQIQVLPNTTFTLPLPLPWTVFIDPDPEDTLGYQLLDPNGQPSDTFTFNPNGPTVSGTVGQTPKIVLWQATDLAGASATTPITFNPVPAAVFRQVSSVTLSVIMGVPSSLSLTPGSFFSSSLPVSLSASSVPGWVIYNASVMEFHATANSSTVAFTLIGSNTSGGRAEIPINVIVAPGLTIQSPDSGLDYLEGEPLPLPVAVSSTDREVKITYRLEPNDGSGTLTFSLKQNITRDPLTRTWTYEGEPGSQPSVTFQPGVYQVTSTTFVVAATDRISPPVSASVKLSGIRVNHSPVLREPVPDIVAPTGVNFFPLNITDHFFDPDEEDNMSASLAVRNGTSSADFNFDPIDNTLSTTSATPPGVWWLVLDVTDNHGGAASTLFKLTLVRPPLASGAVAILAFLAFLATGGGLFALVKYARNHPERFLGQCKGGRRIQTTVFRVLPDSPDGRRPSDSSDTHSGQSTKSRTTTSSDIPTPPSTDTRRDFRPDFLRPFPPKDVLKTLGAGSRLPLVQLGEWSAEINNLPRKPEGAKAPLKGVVESLLAERRARCPGSAQQQFFKPASASPASAPPASAPPPGPKSLRGDRTLVILGDYPPTPSQKPPS